MERTEHRSSQTMGTMNHQQQNHRLRQQPKPLGVCVWVGVKHAIYMMYDCQVRILTIVIWSTHFEIAYDLNVL